MTTLKLKYKIPRWKHNASHALLDIIRGCNIVCQACYNTEEVKTKPYSQVISEFNLIRKKRKLRSISIVGGEPLLHPELDKILAYIKSQNIHINIFTNGVLLTNERLTSLNHLGVKLIFLHIEPGQKRPDLINSDSKAEIFALKTKLATMIVANGMKAGITVTAYKNKISDIQSVIEECIKIPFFTHAQITLYRDVRRIHKLSGNLTNGFKGELDSINLSKEIKFSNNDIINFMISTFNFGPYAYLGSNKSKLDPRWLLYLLAVFQPQEGKPIVHNIKPSILEKISLFLNNCFKRKSFFYQEHTIKQILTFLRLNTLLVRYHQNTNFLKSIVNKKGSIRFIKITFQTPAMLNDNKELIFCDNCPDVVIKDGHIVPVCISDRVTNKATSKLS